VSDAGSTSLTPTVEVFVQLIDGAGMQFWQRFRCIGSDHQTAASEALQALAGVFRVLDMLTFDGQTARQWNISAEERTTT
jgi:hypothetical protein